MELKINLSNIRINDLALVTVMLLGTVYSLFFGWKIIFQLEKEAMDNPIIESENAVGLEIQKTPNNSNILHLNYELRNIDTEINASSLELGKTNPFE